MKYKASEQKKFLVVQYQNTTEVGQLLYPAIDIITNTIETVFSLKDSSKENFYENKHLQLVLGNLQIVINPRINYTAFQEYLIRLQKINKSLSDHLNILRLFFEQDKNVYDQKAFSNLSNLGPASFKLYTEKVKEILSNHISAICIEFQNDKKNQEILNNPLYKDTLRLLLKRKLHSRKKLENCIFFTAKAENKINLSEEGEQKEEKITKKHT